MTDQLEKYPTPEWSILRDNVRGINYLCLKEAFHELFVCLKNTSIIVSFGGTNNAHISKCLQRTFLPSNFYVFRDSQTEFLPVESVHDALLILNNTSHDPKLGPTIYQKHTDEITALQAIITKLTIENNKLSEEVVRCNLR